MGGKDIIVVHDSDDDNSLSLDTMRTDTVHAFWMELERKVGQHYSEEEPRLSQIEEESTQHLCWRIEEHKLVEVPTCSRRFLVDGGFRGFGGCRRARMEEVPTQHVCWRIEEGWVVEAPTRSRRFLIVGWLIQRTSTRPDRGSAPCCLRWRIEEDRIKEAPRCYRPRWIEEGLIAE